MSLCDDLCMTPGGAGFKPSVFAGFPRCRRPSEPPELGRPSWLGVDAEDDAPALSEILEPRKSNTDLDGDQQGSEPMTLPLKLLCQLKERNFFSLNMMSEVPLTEEFESVGVTGLLRVGDEGGVREAHTRWTMWYSSCWWSLKNPMIKMNLVT